MGDRLNGIILIVVGLSIAGFGGTMSTILYAVFYIVGFLTAFTGLGFFIKYYRKTTTEIDDGIKTH